MNTMTLEEWQQKAILKFGKNWKDWQFRCPSCKTIQTGQDFLDAGKTIDEIRGYLGFSCIGRITKTKGCDWSLGGLLRIHTLEIITNDNKHHPRFEFA